jgi:hypothetical protein
MWYSKAGERICGIVILGTGNVVRYCWGQKVCYSKAGDRKCGRVILGTGNVVQ